MDGRETVVGVDSTSHSVVLSTPAEGTGIKPSDLLPIALAACTAVDEVEILEISSDSGQDQDSPWTFRKIRLHFKAAGKSLTEAAPGQAIHLAEEKYCSVAATIRATAQITFDLEIPGQAEGPEKLQWSA